MKRRSFKKVIITLLFVNIIAVFVDANPTIYRVAPPSVIFEVLALNRDLSTKKKPKYRSTSELVASPDEKYIYLCEETAKKIAIFDVENNNIVDRIRLPNNVTGCAVSKDGKTLYATCASDIWP
ncbi:MAG: lactonase family protein, partial [Chitinispirillaceae bacterium]|nr:lactonase family protein [Chitinispirillaceae bacterium]